MHLRRTKWHQPGAITHPEDAGDLEAKSPANQSSMKAGHNIFWTYPASEAPSGAGEKMLFISLVNFLSVSHKSLKQSTHLATLYHSQHEGFLVAQLVKNPPRNVEDLASIPGSGRSPGERKGYPLQYSGLENVMDHIVHGLTKSQT